VIKHLGLQCKIIADGNDVEGDENNEASFLSCWIEQDRMGNARSLPETEPSRLRCLRSGLVSTDVWLCLVTGCGKVRTCGLVDLQTDQRVNCGPKLADRQCGPVGKLRTTKMRIPRNRTPNERCAELTVAFMCYAPLYAFTAAVQAVVWKKLRLM